MWVWAYPAIRLSRRLERRAPAEHDRACPGSGWRRFRDLLRQAGLGPWPASFGAAALLFNPVFFMMSGTFMTDVPALSFSLLALACYQRGFEDRGRWLVPGGRLSRCHRWPG